MFVRPPRLSILRVCHIVGGQCSDDAFVRVVAPAAIWSLLHIIYGCGETLLIDGFLVSTMDLNLKALLPYVHALLAVIPEGSPLPVEETNEAVSDRVRELQAKIQTVELQGISPPLLCVISDKVPSICTPSSSSSAGNQNSSDGADGVGKTSAAGIILFGNFSSRTPGSCVVGPNVRCHRF